MTARIVNWQSGIESLGKAVAAIGVFDGVHLGHQALLRDTVADARSRDVLAVAITFDRDPDQVIAPDSAAPQLMPLADKLAAISATGVDIILVVPFTERLAELAPESFVDDVLLGALSPAAVHVGGDFRFGHRATGSVSTLVQAGAVHGFKVVAHELLSLEGAPVTSTRIRGLVAAGHVDEAAALLGSKPCVRGSVQRGRGEGRQFGFPTANVAPVPYAALPGDGVYAGRAVLQDGSAWAAAISVGTPPMFPAAKDYLEAHLIQFSGDLYDQTIELQFWKRLRSQQRYPSLEELKAAIAEDVRASLGIAGFTDEELAAGAGSNGGAREAEAWGRPSAAPAFEPVEGDAGLVDDPAALEAAERAVFSQPPSPAAAPVAEDFVEVLSGMRYDKTRFSDIEAALTAAGISTVWSPYPPREAPLLRLGIWDTERFSLSVPGSQHDAARQIVAELGRGTRGER